MCFGNDKSPSMLPPSASTGGTKTWDSHVPSGENSKTENATMSVGPEKSQGRFSQPKGKLVIPSSSKEGKASGLKDCPES